MDDKLIFKTGARLLVLGAGFFVIRFPLFSWISSYDWHRVMILLSSAMIALFSINGYELTANCLPLLYIASYVAAHYFRTDGYDPGGGAISNAWFLWTLFFVASAAPVYLIDRVFHVKHKGIKHD